ncbi:MAG: ATP-binding cassette domain-containing protein [Spirochaetales bacterium]|nr:ATP-binding cassette domain-containing protein [Spirochaetales bacterium]
MVVVDNVTMIFNEGTPDENRVLSNISLKVDIGDFVTIIGSNGAGKSTLFNVIAGTYRPTAGEIYINKKRVTKDPEYKRARYIGRIFQNPLMGTAGNMSLEDNLMISCKKGFKWPVLGLNQKMRALFREQLKQLDMDLEDRLKDNVGLFSGGQRQALTLLMMVLSRPDLVLLDEHTAALDPKNAELVLQLTEKFIAEYRLTTVMVTHNMGHAIKFGNRLLMMDKGEIILDVSGKQKEELTIEKLVEKFHEIRHRDFTSDEVLLTE